MPLENREQILKALDKKNYDVAVIGGGVIGACIALKASMSGLKTILVEKNDYACEASLDETVLHGLHVAQCSSNKLSH